MMHINSPRTDDDAIEQEIRSKGLNSPRITPKDVEALALDFAPEIVFRYLNRLGDWCFVAARYINQSQGVSEPIWSADTSR